MKKKILITIADGFVARNILRTGVLNALLQSGASILLVCPPERREYYEKEFGGSNVSVAGVRFEVENRRELFIRFIEKNCLLTKIVWSTQKEYLMASRTLRSLVFFLIKRLIGIIGLLPDFFACVRRADTLLVETKPSVAAFLGRERPDLVFATNVMDDIDIAVLRETRRLGIRSVGMVKSWDNLTNHGIVRVLPDELIVHSPWLCDRARNLQKIRRIPIHVTGTPQYDSFYRKDFLKPREDFCRELGIQPQSRIILFAAIGITFAPYEWEIPQIIADGIERGKLPKDCIVVARPHPNFGVTKGLEPKSARIVIDQPAHYITDSVFTWEMENKDMEHFANVLYHANVVVTGGSTITIDAAIFDRPVVNYAFDGMHRLPYWRSARRVYEQYTHYLAALKTGAVRVVYSADELFREVDVYLENPGRDREGRARLVKEFAGSADARSSERVAAVVLSAVEKP